MGQKRQWAAGAVGLLQLVVLGSFVLIGSPSAPHGAPVAIVADPVVVAAVGDQLAGIDSGALELRSAESPAAARAGVADGSLVAAVVVDLGDERDAVLLASANGDELNRGVVELVETVESSFGRDVVVQDVVPVRADDVDARGVYVIVGLCVLLGFIAPIALTWLRGPVAPTWARGVWRLAIIAGSATVGGLVVAVFVAGRYDDGLLAWWLIAALTLSASATVTLALEGLFGVLGIGVATALLVLSAAPMARLASPLMLPGPWRTITPWLPHGAALDVARGQAYFGGGDLQPLLVLGIWSLLAVLTLAVARRERDVDAAEGASSLVP